MDGTKAAPKVSALDKDIKWSLENSLALILQGSIIATSASLDDPSGVAVDSSGNLNAADSGNNRIQFVATARARRRVPGGSRRRPRATSTPSPGAPAGVRGTAATPVPPRRRSSMTRSAWFSTRTATSMSPTVATTESKRSPTRPGRSRGISITAKVGRQQAKASSRNNQLFPSKIWHLLRTFFGKRWRTWCFSTAKSSGERYV